MRIGEICTGLGIAIISGLSPHVWLMIFPGTPLPNWLVFTGVMSGVALVVFGFLHDRILKPKKETIWLPMMSLHPHGENLFPYRKAMRIKDAAQMVYDKTNKTGLARLAERWAKDHQGMEVLGTYAQYFKDWDGYTLYGKKPSSNIYVVIPANKINSLWFSNDLNELRPLGAQSKADYVDIAVTKKDVQRLVREVKRET